MLKRLFNVTDKSAEPPVVAKAKIGSQNRDFLTASDRQFLAFAYHYASQNNDSPSDVDSLADDIGHYRFLQATGNHVETLPGELWNTDGSPLYWKMNKPDTEIATNILNSRSAANTSLDHGFIAYVLNPRGAGWVNSNNSGHSVDYSFLQKLIDASGGGAGSKIDEKNIEQIYGNSLDWIKRQDQPDYPPKEQQVGSETGIRENSSFEDTESNFAEKLLKLLKTHVQDFRADDQDSDILGGLMRGRVPQVTPASLLLKFLQARINGMDRQ